MPKQPVPSLHPLLAHQQTHPILLGEPLFLSKEGKQKIDDSKCFDVKSEQGVKNFGILSKSAIVENSVITALRKKYFLILNIQPCQLILRKGFNKEYRNSSDSFVGNFLLTV